MIEMMYSRQPIRIPRVLNATMTTTTTTSILSLVTCHLFSCNNKMGDIKQLFSDVVFLLLVVEAILCGVGCFFLADGHVVYYSRSSHHVFVMAVAVYMVITLAFITSYVCDGTDSNQVLFILLFIVGGCLNVASGCLCMMVYVDTLKPFRKSSYIVMFVTTLTCGLIMFVTVFLKAKK